MNKTIRYSSFENKFEVIYRNEIPTIQMPPHTHNAIELYISLTPLSNILLGDNVMPLKRKFAAYNTVILYSSVYTTS